MLVRIAQRDSFVATANRPLDPARESILFVHGAGQDHSIWVLPARYFARKGYNVIAVDLPGHGRSEGPCLPSIEAMADWTVACLQELGLGAAAMVGHSMGSLVALATAATYREQVRSLALVGTAVPMPVSEGLLDAAENNLPDAVRMLTLWGHSPEAHLGGNSNPGMWMLGMGTRLLESASEGVIHADLAACNAYLEGLQHASNVTCPTLLLLGERDRMTPVGSTRELAKSIPHARIIVLPGAGHALLAERPDPVLDALIDVV